MRIILFLAGALLAAPVVADVTAPADPAPPFAARPMVLPAVAATPGAARELGLARSGGAPVLLVQAAGAAEGADNTGRNRSHDRRLEAEDQSNADADVELVAAIRRALTDDDQLSTNAHNIKVVVSGRRVTLRGPVASEAERQRVETLVRQAAAGREVVNQLEVAPR
jgi:hypothetical protein